MKGKDDISRKPSNSLNVYMNYKNLNEKELQTFNKFIEICKEDEDIQKISHNLQL